MSTAFKDHVDGRAIDTLATAIRAVHPDFPSDRFRRDALDGLAPLELMDRVRHVAAALRRALPEDWPAAVAIVLRALPPPVDEDSPAAGGFTWWPVVRMVEDFGADDPETSLAALPEMTRRISAEFAVRPLIARHPDLARAALERWAIDPDPHVRRLVSEGSRPRLPWGRRLPVDPERSVALLDQLVDDPSPYVRRSVANHLGDLAKHDPALALGVARRWLARGGREPTVRHGLRGLLKAGDAEALALLGYGGAVAVDALAIAPGTAKAGDHVEITARVSASEATTVRVDLVWSWPGARGRWSSRTFVGGTRTLAAGEDWPFRHRLSLRPVSTRPLRPGPQRVILRVLGTDHGPIGFTLEE
jgi:3-methyladenine DNA glycosylase AlkC